MQFWVPHCVLLHATRSIADRTDRLCWCWAVRQPPIVVGPLQFVVDGVSGIGQVTADSCSSTPVTDIAALSPSAVDPRSRPSAVRATRWWQTVRGAGLFCAQIPSAGSGDTLNCMSALLGAVQHFRVRPVVPASGSTLSCRNGVTAGRSVAKGTNWDGAQPTVHLGPIKIARSEFWVRASLASELLLRRNWAAGEKQVRPVTSELHCWTLVSEYCHGHAWSGVAQLGSEPCILPQHSHIFICRRRSVLSATNSARPTVRAATTPPQSGWALLLHDRHVHVKGKGGRRQQTQLGRPCRLTKFDGRQNTTGVEMNSAGRVLPYSDGETKVGEPEEKRPFCTSRFELG